MPKHILNLEEGEVRQTLMRLTLDGYHIHPPQSVTATAYDACLHCCGKTDGITRSGVKAKPGETIAVDPRLIPLGSRVYIPELNGIFVANDTGGAIKGNRIDVFMNNHREALQFGRQKLTIYLLDVSI